MNERVFTVILIAVLTIGLGLLIYPSASNYWNSIHQSKAIADYIKSVCEIDDTNKECMLKSAAEYNKTLAMNGLSFELNENELKDYAKQLNPDNSGIIGYLDIKTIGCHLPIYHGVEDRVLQGAIGHIPGSSLPVGGEGTHCVLSGHRGLPSAKLFSQLNSLCVGDTFVIHTLDTTLTYEVDNILTTLPEDTSALNIVDGADYCTLVTCTPYGINTHRLLVRGRRVKNPALSNVHINSEAFVLRDAASTAVFIVPTGALALAALFVFGDIKAKKAAVKKQLGIKRIARARLWEKGVGY